MLLAIFDTLKLAFGTFSSNVLRTMLTLLGIVIGITTVMAMMALLEGLRTKMERDLSQMGARVFQVSKWPAGIHIGGGKGNWAKMGDRPPITIDDKRAILDHVAGISLISAQSMQPGQKISTSMTETQPNVFITGNTVEYPETSGATVADGRYFTEAEDSGGQRVAVLGPDVADRLFPNMTSIGQVIRVKNRPYTVVGVLARRGSIMGMFNLDNVVQLPLRVMLEEFGRRRSVSLNVKVRDGESIDRVQDDVRRLLRQRRKVPPSEEDNFEVQTNESMTKTLNELSDVVTAAAFGVCLLSLFVGGIGILNIMLVTVSERTREIGIRKALGARRRRILAQFALEAVLLSLVGGIVGVGLGYGISWLGRWAFELYTQVPLWAVLLSLGMSAGVGLIFGIYPAIRASRLDAVEAMRAEA